jgi:nucleoside-diphosphate-sugar epimerase
MNTSTFSTQPFSPALFQGKDILITGGTGYLASGIIALLKDVDCRIIRLGKRTDGREEITGAATIVDVVGDVHDREVWEHCLEGVDVIFHLAAQTSTYVANADPLADQAVNVLPILRMLESCRRRLIQPTVCFASTVTVAGIPERLPVGESHPDHPLTVYDLHKQMAEQYLRWYAEQGLVCGVTLRLANIYGPGPRSSSTDRGVLNQMIRHALAGEPLTVYGSGEQLRDYLYVEDAARAFLAAAANGAALSGEYFVVGSGVGHTIAAAAEMVVERAAVRTGKPVEVRYVVPPDTLSPIERRNFVADPRRFCAATGWQPRYSLSTGIDRTLEVLT